MSELPFEVRRLIVIERVSLLKAWVFYRNITQIEIAKKLGISQPAVSIMLNRQHNRKSTLQKMSKLLDVPLNLLETKLFP